jgi:hypothetical protein
LVELILVQIVQRLSYPSAKEDILAISKLQLDAVLEDVGLIQLVAALLTLTEERSVEANERLEVLYYI